MKLESNKNNNQSSTCAIGIIDNQFVRSSTPVENVRQIDLFMQNEPKFPHFSPKNDDLKKNEPKRTQMSLIQAYLPPRIEYIGFCGGKANFYAN